MFFVVVSGHSWGEIAVGTATMVATTGVSFIMCPFKNRTDMKRLQSMSNGHPALSLTLGDAVLCFHHDRFLAVSWGSALEQLLVHLWPRLDIAFQSRLREQT